MKLRWTLHARNDLRNIASYISTDNPTAARTWIEELRSQARNAAMYPLAGRTVPEMDRDDVREVLVRTYRIAYLITNTEIHVLTVFDGLRLFPIRAVRKSHINQSPKESE